MTPIRRHYQIYIERPPEAVFAFHADLKNHARLAPAGQEEEIVIGSEAPLTLGTRILYRATHGGFRRTLIAEIIAFDPPHAFAEQQVEGPFAFWKHQRRFVAFQQGTLMTDLVEYDATGGLVSKLANQIWLGKQADAFFHHRQAEAKRLLERIGRIVGPGR